MAKIETPNVPAKTPKLINVIIVRLLTIANHHPQTDENIHGSTGARCAA
ncbi:hypothetical protein ACH0AE_06820 [Sphingomonas sp. 179-A 2A2 NHS]